jgi:hypothetical protein
VDPALLGLPVDGDESVLVFALEGLGGIPAPRMDFLIPIGAESGAGYGVAGV